MGLIEKAGYVAPPVEKLTTAHSEQILIDILNDGIRPNAKTPNPCADITARKPRSSIVNTPPGCGNPNM